MTRGPTYHATKRVAAREVARELVLLDLDQGSFLVSRGIGPRVWELLLGGLSPEEVAEKVATRYDVDPALVRSDIDAFISALVEKGLLEED